MHQNCLAVSMVRNSARLAMTVVNQQVENDEECIVIKKLKAERLMYSYGYLRKNPHDSIAILV